MSVNDIIADLERFVRPQRQAGDISVVDLMIAKRITNRMAHIAMDKAVQSGDYISLTVYDPEVQKTIRVLRKKV
jgi:hypothetical protein